MRIVRVLSLVVLAVSLAGCGTLKGGRRWGEDATPAPGWDRVVWAAERAALSPGTWVPAAGAAAMSFGDFDQRISDWAREHTPIYGSEDDAADMSTDLKNGLRVASYGTLLATPSGDAAEDWVTSKAKGFAVEWTAEKSTSLATNGLKDLTGSARPRGGDDSFPSSCAADAFTFATLTSRNLESMRLSFPVRTGLQIGAYSVAGASAWARVEAGAHYPSDVLAGAALGHFLGSFVHDAFLGLPDGRGPEFEIAPSPAGVSVAVTFSF
jgi:PAP2 superfamily